MMFVLIVTLVIISPVAGYIVTYKCLYSHMPCESINNVKVGVERDIVEFEHDDKDNNIIFFNNNIRIEQDNNEFDNTMLNYEEVNIGVE